MRPPPKPPMWPPPKPPMWPPPPPIWPPPPPCPPPPPPRACAAVATRLPASTALAKITITRRLIVLSIGIGERPPLVGRGSVSGRGANVAIEWRWDFLPVVSTKFSFNHPGLIPGALEPKVARTRSTTGPQTKGNGDAFPVHAIGPDGYRELEAAQFDPRPPRS